MMKKTELSSIKNKHKGSVFLYNKAIQRGKNLNIIKLQYME